MKKTLTSLALAASFLAGCDVPQQTYQEATMNGLRSLEQQERAPVTVSGIPLAPSIGISDSSAFPCYLSFMLTDKEKPILVYTDKIEGLKATKARTLIQSEIDDGDDEERITVRGFYNANTRELEAKSITANEYTVDF